MRRELWTTALPAAYISAMLPLLLALALSNPLGAPFAGGALFVWNGGSGLRAEVYRGVQPKSIALPGERCSIAPAGDVALLLCTMADSSVIAVRIDANGDEIPSRRMMPLSGPVSVAWNGSKFLVAWVDHVGQITNQLFDRDWNPVAPPHWLFRFSPNDVAVQVTTAGDRFVYLIEETWRGNCGIPECPVPGANVNVQPIDAAGTPLPEVVVAKHGWRPRATTDGRELLLVWTEFPRAGIHARRLTPDGALLGDEVAIDGGPAYDASVVWDGTFYDVAFRRETVRDLARVNRDLATVVQLEQPGGVTSELVVAGDRLLRARVEGGQLVVEDLSLRPRGRAAKH